MTPSGVGVKSNRPNFELIFIEFFKHFLPFWIIRIAKFWIESNEFWTNSNLTSPLFYPTFSGLLLKMKIGATRGVPRVPKKSPNTTGDPNTRPEANSIMNGNLEERKMTMRSLTRKKQREDMSHARLDILFLLLFPLFFLIFNVIYWASFLYGTERPCYNIECIDE